MKLKFLLINLITILFLGNSVYSQNTQKDSSIGEQRDCVIKYFKEFMNASDRNPDTRPVFKTLGIQNPDPENALKILTLITSELKDEKLDVDSNIMSNINEYYKASNSTNEDTLAYSFVKQGTSFYKLVPFEKSDNFNYNSPFYITNDVLLILESKPSEIESELGLPLYNYSSSYAIKEVTCQSKNGCLILKSKVAPTEFINKQNGAVHKTNGGAEQVILPNITKSQIWNGDKKYNVKQLIPIAIPIPHFIIDNPK